MSLRLVCYFDADKKVFFVMNGLIQTIGRAARNSEGHVIICDKITESMQKASG